MDLQKEIMDILSDAGKDRCYLHRHPELAFQEYNTTKFLKERLTEFGVELEPLNMETGVSAIIRGAYPGPTICIRHDLDALPIQETTGLDFASEVGGVSHSCGHDIHAITAIYSAKILQQHKDELHGNVRIVIQPAEEGGKGAYAMVEAGAMELLPKTDIVVGIHVHPATPAGSITLMKGPAEAGSDHVKIRVKGIGGHGAYPHLCVDPIVVSAFLIAELQTVVSRECMPQKPAVLTFGTIKGGNADNVISNEVVITGTLRSLYPDSREHNKEAIVRITENLCRSMRAEGIVEFGGGMPPVVNDPDVVDGIIAAADAVLGPGHVINMAYPSMGSDDFSVFLDYSKGAQFFVGSANENPETQIGLHRGENVFDPDSIRVAISVLTRYILDELS